MSASIACAELHNDADFVQSEAVLEDHAVCVGVLAPVPYLGRPEDEVAVDADATWARSP